jgi:hypothetical protein
MISSMSDMSQSEHLWAAYPSLGLGEANQMAIVVRASAAGYRRIGATRSPPGVGFVTARILSKYVLSPA